MKQETYVSVYWMQCTYTKVFNILKKVNTEWILMLLWLMSLLTFFHDVLMRSPRVAFLESLFLIASFAREVRRKKVWKKKNIWNRQNIEKVFGNYWFYISVVENCLFLFIYYSYSSDNIFATLGLLILSDGQKSLQAMEL